MKCWSGREQQETGNLLWIECFMVRGDRAGNECWETSWTVSVCLIHTHTNTPAS